MEAEKAYARIESMKRIKMGIGIKLSIYLIGSMIVIFAALTFLTIAMHRQHLEQFVIDSALRISDTIKNSTHHDMLHSSPDEENAKHINRIINTIGSQKGIERIRIFNKEGRILYSTDQSEIQKLVDKRAESCYICHASDKPLTKLDKDQRWRIFRAADGHRILGLINPIENEESCISNNCHQHERDAALLGVLDVNMSLREADALIAGDLMTYLAAYLVTMLTIALASGGFVMVMIHKPVKRLIEGTRRVALGELTYKLEAGHSDEIGELADSFNRMTSDLKEARDEITNWARTLEKRVAEKTEELKRTQDNIIRIEKMASLGKLSAIVAHEINNPLMGVLTYSKLLQKRINKRLEDIPEGQEHDFDDCLKYASIIESETARAGDIVKNLLLFSKQTTIQLEPNNLNSLIERSIMLVNHQMELSSIECSTEFSKELPPVKCDGGQIQQVVVALLVNSVEAIGEGGKITVASEYDRQRGLARIIVSDTGVGMDDDTKKHLFEPFFSTKKGRNGTGLGLAVVYGIVERHQGKVRVESEPGKGATFVVELQIDPPIPVEDLSLPQGTRPERI
jgi:two-component system NtrC family sensor kinase